MELAMFCVGFSLTLSLLVNVVLYLIIRSKKNKKQETYDVMQLMHDLTNGVALVKIERISPMDVFLRSPRDA